MRSKPNREFDSLRLSVTDECNLNCFYCRPPFQRGREDRVGSLSFDQIVRLVRHLKESFGLGSVRLTGGEPLLRPGLTELVGMLAGLGLDDLALTSNGQLLAPLARDLKRAGLNRVNISLDSLDPDRYRHLTAGGDLLSTLAGIEAALNAGLHPVKLNTVVLKGLNDREAADIVSFGLNSGCEVRFLELMAIGPMRDDHDEWYFSSENVLSVLREEFSLEPMPSPANRPARRWRVHDRRGRMGTVGFISPESEPFCEACGRLRLSADGRLFGCLMLDDGVDLRPILEVEGADFGPLLDRAVRTVFGVKPRVRPRRSDQSMYLVGG